ncbi:unnamed protein product [Amoebophrya sp. A25]|nr:unnamed protein product [Amoebophrya sp. A25]|eukprot:GSA25T00024957001.1
MSTATWFPFLRKLAYLVGVHALRLRSSPPHSAVRPALYGKPQLPQPSVIPPLHDESESDLHRHGNGDLRLPSTSPAEVPTEAAYCPLCLEEEGPPATSYLSASSTSGFALFADGPYECSHRFCLDCLQGKGFRTPIMRHCPQCRAKSLVSNYIRDPGGVTRRIAEVHGLQHVHLDVVMRNSNMAASSDPFVVVDMEGEGTRGEPDHDGADFDESFYSRHTPVTHVGPDEDSESPLVDSIGLREQAREDFYRCRPQQEERMLLPLQDQRGAHNCCSKDHSSTSSSRRRQDEEMLDDELRRAVHKQAMGFMMRLPKAFDRIENTPLWSVLAEFYLSPSAACFPFPPAHHSPSKALPGEVSSRSTEAASTSGAATARATTSTSSSSSSSNLHITKIPTPSSTSTSRRTTTSGTSTSSRAHNDNDKGRERCSRARTVVKQIEKLQQLALDLAAIDLCMRQDGTQPPPLVLNSDVLTVERAGVNGSRNSDVICRPMLEVVYNDCNFGGFVIDVRNNRCAKFAGISEKVKGNLLLQAKKKSKFSSGDESRSRTKRSSTITPSEVDDEHDEKHRDDGKDAKKPRKNILRRLKSRLTRAFTWYRGQVPKELLEQCESMATTILKQKLEEEALQIGRVVQQQEKNQAEDLQQEDQQGCVHATTNTKKSKSISSTTRTHSTHTPSEKERISEESASASLAVTLWELHETRVAPARKLQNAVAILSFALLFLWGFGVTPMVFISCDRMSRKCVYLSTSWSICVCVAVPTAIAHAGLVEGACSRAWKGLKKCCQRRRTSQEGGEECSCCFPFTCGGVSSNDVYMTLTEEQEVALILERAFLGGTSSAARGFPGSDSTGEQTWRCRMQEDIKDVDDTTSMAHDDGPSTNSGTLMTLTGRDQEHDQHGTTRNEAPAQETDVPRQDVAQCETGRGVSTTTTGVTPSANAGGEDTLSTYST